MSFADFYELFFMYDSTFWVVYETVRGELVISDLLSAIPGGRDSLTRVRLLV